MILLNYRNVGDTLRCLASLRRSQSRSLHPVVVDNGSGGDTVDRLEHALGPAVPVLVSPTNGGYAAGNNLGIRYALARDADFVWILNPDTEVEPRTLQLLMASMSLRPDAGVVGSLNLFGGSNPPTVQFAGGTIDWDAGAVTESIGRGRPLAERTEREPYRVDYANGASMLVRRGVFEEVGLLPALFPLLRRDPLPGRGVEARLDQCRQSAGAGVALPAVWGGAPSPVLHLLLREGSHSVRQGIHRSQRREAD